MLGEHRRGGFLMYRYAFAAALLIAMLPSAPLFAVSAKDKMATCKFGADDQKLQGAARTAFMKKCMLNKNDPRGPATGTPAASGTVPPPKQ
jgi:psiF repeat